jgi:hypothetical protein
LQVLEVLATVGHHPGKQVRPVKTVDPLRVPDTGVLWCRDSSQQGHMLMGLMPALMLHLGEKDG